MRSARAGLLTPALALLSCFLLVPLLVAIAISLRLPAPNLQAYVELINGTFRAILFGKQAAPSPRC